MGCAPVLSSFCFILAGHDSVFRSYFCPADSIAGCEELTQRRRDSQRYAEKEERKGSSPLRFSAPSASLR